MLFNDYLGIDIVAIETNSLGELFLLTLIVPPSCTLRY